MVAKIISNINPQTLLKGVIMLKYLKFNWIASIMFTITVLFAIPNLTKAGSCFSDDNSSSSGGSGSSSGSCSNGYSGSSCSSGYSGSIGGHNFSTYNNGPKFITELAIRKARRNDGHVPHVVHCGTRKIHLSCSRRAEIGRRIGRH